MPFPPADPELEAEADPSVDEEAQLSVLDDIQRLMDSLESKKLEATVKLSRKAKDGPAEEKAEDDEEAAEGETSDVAKLKALAK